MNLHTEPPTHSDFAEQVRAAIRALAERNHEPRRYTLYLSEANQAMFDEHLTDWRTGIDVVTVGGTPPEQPSRRRRYGGWG